MFYIAIEGNAKYFFLEFLLTLPSELILPTVSTPPYTDHFGHMKREHEE